MTESERIENAFGLRWLQDDDRGRLVYGSANGEFRSPEDAINVLRLDCDEAVLREALDRFPPHVRIHGGYTPFIGDPVTRLTLTWEPGTPQAAFVHTRDGADEDGMTGNVDVPATSALKEILMDLLVPDARDVVDRAREEGKPASMKDVDFWIGDRHFTVPDEEPS